MPDNNTFPQPVENKSVIKRGERCWLVTKACGGKVGLYLVDDNSCLESDVPSSWERARALALTPLKVYASR